MFCLWGCMKRRVWKRNLDKRDELLAGILDVAVQINEPDIQLRRTTRDLRTRVAKCVEVGGGIFSHLLRSVTNFSFLCNKFVFKHLIIIQTKLTAGNLPPFIVIQNACLLVHSITFISVNTHNYTPVHMNIFHDIRYYHLPVTNHFF